MHSSIKYRRKAIIQACGEGDLESFKKNFNELGHLEHSIINEVLYYCVRSCNIECVKYLINTERTSLMKMDNKDDIVWHIINKNGINQIKRIEMFRYLYDNGLTFVAEDVINKYIQLRRKEYLKMALNEFSIEIDLNKLLLENQTANALDRRYEFISEVYQEIRNEKIDSIL